MPTSGAAVNAPLIVPLKWEVDTADTHGAVTQDLSCKQQLDAGNDIVSTS